ncbi:iron chelate uptake ABC transporter family permease subunit [Clostridium bowmanii]|uniref:iron chelate uptake ABC transporter family permease subunit n=1 Tax=Clostridium bowmanii TaxID=132925 RepID=UPI001CD34F7E|nr:iron chelate uptake ABC transporter family permease subunit [Clostridium bowmanii]MCA1075845.1 iron chelate uptake ABC transporter family permease subunit [Clostridium bowmanii]
MLDLKWWDWSAEKSGYYAISSEVLPQYAGDYMVFCKNSTGDNSFQKTDTYKNIPVVKNNAITIVFMPSANYVVILISCFVGAAVAVLLVFGISASKKGGFSSIRIVLAGSAISTFLYAVAQGIQIYFKVSRDVSMWTSGGLVGTSWEQLAIIVPFILVGITIAIVLSRQLTILSLSEEVAIGLGQKTATVKAVFFVVVILLAGAAVALASNLVFIGLIVLHVAYFVVGRDYRFVIPISAVFGATL